MMVRSNTPVEKRVLVPAALEQWAAEHSNQLSAETLAEVQKIADTIDSSSLSQRLVTDVGEDFDERLHAVFGETRAERASALVQIVSEWAAKQPAANEPEALATPATSQHDVAVEPVALDAPPVPVAASSYPVADVPGDHPLDDPIEAPAFLRSDKVDEEDDVRLYGPKRPWKAILGTFLVLAIVGGLGLFGWYWFTQRTDTIETTATEAPPVEPTPADDSAAAAEPTAAPTAAPTAEPEPTAVLPSYWADTVPILNSGTAEIAASTYAVSPANRAVLTGHTSAITGVAVSDDGRVLTSGADRRLVDWGADVTLANPDVLNVPSPLTVLERTRDQRIVAGDSVGNVTIIDLVNTVDPVVLPIHRVAVSALAELADGQLAVASVDGDVDVFDVESSDDRITLAHDVEVTAVVAIADGTVATAAVDGIIRLWSPDGQGEPGEIATLDAPVTAMTMLANGQLAAASVDGNIHVFDAAAGASASVELPGHIGAVRSLYEVTLDDGLVALASGGDDTTIRLWNLQEQAEIRVLEGHGDIISGIDALPDGRLVSTSGDGTGRVWDLSVPSGQPVNATHNWNLSALHPWSNDQFVTGGIDGNVVLASTSVTSQPIAITQHDAPIVGVSVFDSDSAGAGDIVSLDASSVLRITQAAGGSTGPMQLDVAAGATALDVRDAGLVTGHADGTVRLYQLGADPAEDGSEDDASDASTDGTADDDAADEPDSLQEALVVSAHGSGVNDVTALSSGLIVSAGHDSTVRIIDPEDPEAIRVFDLHTGPVDVVTELPDGRIASAGSDGIYIYTAEELAQSRVRLNGQRSRTISLVPLAGDRLISTGEDGRVRLWDLTTPEEEPSTLVDIPGVVNPHLIQADNGLFVAGAARGYVVFTLS